MRRQLDLRLDEELERAQATRLLVMMMMVIVVVVMVVVVMMVMVVLARVERVVLAD